jgi:hypothetical protein
MVDGNTQASKSGQWQSFLAVKDTFSSIGQKVADTDIEAGDTDVAVEVWIFHACIDRVGTRVDNMREFPFDASVTDKELYFKGYGSGLKTTATFTALIPAAGKFVTDTINAF